MFSFFENDASEANECRREEKVKVNLFSVSSAVTHTMYCDSMTSKRTKKGRNTNVLPFFVAARLLLALHSLCNHLHIAHITNSPRVSERSRIVSKSEERAFAEDASLYCVLWMGYA